MLNVLFHFQINTICCCFALPEFLGSEPKFAEPTARPEGAVRCTAAKLVSDPNNSFAPNLLSI